MKGKKQKEPVGFNPAEIFAALALLEKERGIPQSFMMEKIIQALTTAYKRDHADVENVIVDVDEEHHDLKMFVQKNVVAEEDYVDPANEMPVEEAKKLSAKYEVGDVVNLPVDTVEFGRIAAGNGKQVIIQGLREAERGQVYDEFNSKQHEILTGVVTPHRPPERQRVPADRHWLRLHGGAADRRRAGARRGAHRGHACEGVCGGGPPQHPRPPGADLPDPSGPGEAPVRAGGAGDLRRHRGGQVHRREAGSRTKMAVWSNDENVDPRCLRGPQLGQRVGSIVEELRGEKIDIVKYSEDPAAFIAAALAPADVLDVWMADEGKACRVIVPDDQLSLAIGKEGQNARLAARLTGYKIDIKPESYHDEEEPAEDAADGGAEEAVPADAE